MRQKIGALLCVVFFGIAVSSTQAHALDKRLKLMFKTAGYGAVAGAVIGAGTVAIGWGDFKNVFMGASAGMYAGILFAGYLVATQSDYEAKYRRGPRNPYAPRRPVGRDDWEDEPEENYKDYLPPEEEESEFQVFPSFPILAQQRIDRGSQWTVWSPVAQLRF